MRNTLTMGDEMKGSTITIYSECDDETGLESWVIVDDSGVFDTDEYLYEEDGDSEHDAMDIAESMKVEIEQEGFTVTIIER